MEKKSINSFRLQNINCSGCEACVATCPKNCIRMERDNEGFLYPVINTDICIDCKLCEKVCGAVNEFNGTVNINQEVYNVVTKDDNVWLDSSSGGIFTEICIGLSQYAKLNEKKVYFFGATMKKNKVFHTYVERVEEVSIFRKSKYIQSHIDDSYTMAKKFLEAGNYVLFSGTPCQIAGLKTFLRKDYERLFCVDFICHGVGSQTVFEDNIKYIENKYNKTIEQYVFRTKKVFFGNIERYNSLYKFTDGSYKSCKYDLYNRLFLSEVCLRKSCIGICKYRNTNRFSDITMADLNQKMKVLPKNKDYRNYSSVVVNTEKGKEVFNLIQDRLIIYPCNIETIKLINPLFFKNISHNVNRNEFFEKYKQGISIEELSKEFGVNPPKGIYKIKNYIPFRLKSMIYYWRKGIKNEK